MTTVDTERLPAPPAEITTGRIARLAVPLVLSSATVLGSQLVVTGLIGRMGDTALYVRAVYAPIAFVFLAIMTGLAVTVQVATARCVGRGEPGGIPRYLGGVARVGGVLSLLVGGLLIAAAGPLGDLVDIAPEHRGLFRQFLILMVLAAVPGLLGELCSAVLRGLGLGGVAATLTLTFVGLNVAIVAGVGLALHGGLMAVPLGGAAAGLVELVLGLAVLLRRRILTGRALLGWRPDTPRLVLAVGLPISASYAVLFMVNLLLLRIVAPAGQHAVAGFNVGYTLQTLVIVPAVGFGSAIAVLMNQQIAGGGRVVAMGTYRRGILLGAGCYAAVTAALVFAGRPIVALLSTDPGIVAESGRFVSIVGPTFGCTGVVLIALTVLEQLGYGPVAVAMNVGYFAAIIAVGWWATVHYHSVGGLYWTMTIATLASVVSGLPYASWIVRRSTAKAGAS
jgi:Na+-driven multidrug efflux pump